MAQGASVGGRIAYLGRESINQRMISAKRAIAPCQDKRGSDNHKTDAEADPDSERAPTPAEGQNVAERKTDHPVPDQVGNHRPTRVARTAQRTGGDGL